MATEKAGVKSNGEDPRTAEFETIGAKVLFGGLEGGEYPKLTLIVGGSVRQYEPAKDFDGKIPELGSLVTVEFVGYRVNVTAVAKSTNQYQRSIETLQVLSMRTEK